MSDIAESLRELLENHGRQLHVLLTRLTLREDVAEDLMQELFLKLNRSSAFIKAQQPAAYAYRTAIHLAFDWHKQGKKRLLSEPLLSEPAEAERPSPLDSLVRREEFEEVLDALAMLRGRSRQILVMRYLQDESYEQIAEAFGKTPHQIRGLCSKAVGKLRTFIDPEPILPIGKEHLHE